MKKVVNKKIASALAETGEVADDRAFDFEEKDTMDTNQKKIENIKESILNNFKKTLKVEKVIETPQKADSSKKKNSKAFIN